MDRIEKSWKELDFDKVDFNSGSWSWGNGGFPHQDDEWSISYIQEDMVEIRYKMPKCISEMLIMRYNFGNDDARRKIQRAIGL